MNQFERRKEHPDSIVENDRTGLPDRRGPEYSIDHYLKSEGPVAGGHVLRAAVLLSLLMAISVTLAFIAYVLIRN